LRGCNFFIVYVAAGFVNPAPKVRKSPLISAL